MSAIPQMARFAPRAYAPTPAIRLESPRKPSLAALGFTFAKGVPLNECGLIGDWIMANYAQHASITQLERGLFLWMSSNSNLWGNNPVIEIKLTPPAGLRTQFLIEVKHLSDFRREDLAA